jgi:hypothetical protein
MNTRTNQTLSAQSTTGASRIILASAYRHERHSTGRQERAVKTLRKMGRFDDKCTISAAVLSHRVCS